MKHFKKIFFTMAFFAVTSRAQEAGPFGLGFMLGDPTGLSAKYNLTYADSIDGGLGWSLTNDNELHIHADYLRHFRELIPLQDDGMDVHVGLGGRITTFDDNGHQNDGDTVFGVRLPVGLDYTFKKVPIEAFLEIAGLFDFIPDSDFTLNFALGARYYF